MSWKTPPTPILDEHKIVKEIHGSRIRSQISVREDLVNMLNDRNALITDCFRRAMDEGLTMEELATVCDWSLDRIKAHMNSYPAN